MDRMMSNPNSCNIDHLPEEIKFALSQFKQVTDLLHRFIQKKEFVDGELEGENILEKIASLSHQIDLTQGFSQPKIYV